jgi:cysteinyl-tRNA synthetase
MNLHIHNTLTNKKELFLPCSSAESINMYVCGPTVYSEPHIGNARAALTGDLFYRVLKELFENVVYMRNLTDVDDKIIDQSSKTGIPISKLTEDVACIYQKNMLELNMLKPTHEPKVTDNIDNIISTIEKILINKSAYISEKHVVFDTVAFDNYGTLSKKIANDLIDGARIKPEAFKRNQKDFVLWKPSQNDKHGWDSPWGYGRPGWHIECTSMIKSIIGNNNTLDIHGGGNDLIFPHHENEIAQGSCCSSSKYCNYWFHNGIVLVNKKKMSKSLGNVILVSDIINRYDPFIIRLALMSTHYRQPLNWTDDTINNAKNIYEKISRTLDNASQLDVTRDDNFLELLCDDINTPNAIQYLIKQAKLARDDIKVMSKLKYNCQLIGIVNNRKSIEINPDEKQMIENLIEKREMARKNKDFVQADSIRDQLTTLSVVLEDGPSGVTWKIKR